MSRVEIWMVTLLLAALGGCASENLSATTPVAQSNILKPEFTTPHAGTAHVRLYRLPANMDTRCDATVQISFRSLAEGRIADVAKIWPLDRLDLYLDPGDYRLNVYSGLCSDLPPVDVDMSLKAGDAVIYRLFTGQFNMTLTPEPSIR
jgi:hypothetical protein